MKHSFLIFVLLILTLCLLLSGCGKKGRNDETTVPGTEPGTEGVTEPTTETTEPSVTEPPVTLQEEYEIRWILQSGIFRTTAKAGEIPTPPDNFDAETMTDTTVYTFTGWDKTLLAASSDAVYTATYDTAPRPYDVTFVVDGTATVAATPYGTIPVYSGAIPTGKAIFWETEFARVTGAATYIGTTLDDRDDFDYLAWSLRQAPMFYQPGTSEDNTSGGMDSSVALYYLVSIMRQEDDPPALVLARINEHLSRMLGGGGYEPAFGCCCYWNYNIVSASLALIRHTPAIWDQLTPDMQDRCDLAMACFAYASAFGTDDENSYKTGPDLKGNFYKTWNPNYRLANVPNILYAVGYFGSADAVNALLLGFDYDAVIAKFDAYGWTDAKAAWSHEPFELEDGNLSTSSRDLLTKGGTAYFEVDLERNGQYRGGYAGQGVGVRTTYSWQGYPLKNVAGIVSDLLSFNYGGGVVFSTWYENGAPLAYIIDGTVSPMEGKTGMMLEFNSGDGQGKRVSAAYCLHDFALSIVTALTLEELGLYSIEDDPDLFDLMYVGNTDLIYKLEHGFMSYSLGHGYENYEGWGDGYLTMKYVWNTRLAPRYQTEEELSEDGNVLLNRTGDAEILVPIKSGSNLKYDMQTGGIATKANQIQFTTDDYVFWDFDYLTGPTAKLTIFFIRSGSANVKNDLLVFRPGDDGSTFTVGDASVTVADGWHHVTIVVNQTNEGTEITLHSRAYIDGVLLGGRDFTPAGNNYLYSVASDGTIGLCPANTFFYIYMDFSAPKTEGYLKVRDEKVGYGQSATGSFPKPTGSVTYVTNGGTFVALGEMTRDTIVLSDDSTRPAYTHTYYDIDHFYTTGTLSSNTFFKRISFRQPNGLNLVRDGYAFDGWYLDEALTLPLERSALDGSSITLYAKWIPEGGNLTFDLAGGSGYADNESAPRAYKFGDASISLPTPVRNLALFEGWYLSADYAGERYVGTYPLAEGQLGSMTFYAKWTMIGGNVVFDLVGDGTPTGEYSHTFLFTDATLTLPDGVEREGYLFNGWYTSATLAPETRIEGTTYAIPAGTAGDLHFYASFIRTGADVTYRAPGTLTGDYAKSYRLNTASTLTLPTVDLKGYTFLGWYLSADFSGAGYSGSYELAAENATDAGITFYAKMQANTVIDSTAAGFTFTNGRPDTITFTQESGQSKFTFRKSSGYDCLFNISGLTSQLGIYAFEFTLAKPSEDAAVPNIGFRIHSASGAASTTPRRSEDHVFATDASGKMFFSVGDSVEVGEITTTPKTVTLLFDYATTPGTLYGICYVDGVKVAEGSMKSDNYTKPEAAERFGEVAQEGYHYPGIIYVYAPSSAAGDLEIGNLYFAEGYLAGGDGNAYNTKYLQTFGN